MIDFVKTLDELCQKKARVPVMASVNISDSNWFPGTLSGETIELWEFCEKIRQYLARYSEMERDFDSVLKSPSSLEWDDKWAKSLAVKWKKQVRNIKPNGEYGYEK